MPSTAAHTLHVPSYSLPESYFLNQRSCSVLKAAREQAAVANPSEGVVSAVNLWQQPELFYQSEAYQALRKRYCVDFQTQTLAGVHCEVFTPEPALASSNEARVLINLHGGGFDTGSRVSSHLESIPVAAIGGIKVISIDYRQAPECRFPAASEDVAAVYKTILKDYEPKNIGFYGTSAGGVLTAQSIAWCQKEGLPLPAAVAMIAGAASPMEGDSLMMTAPIIQAESGMDVIDHCKNLQYFEAAERNTPLVTPAVCDEIMSRFPPSFLASSTRDFLLSSVLATHRQLVGLGVAAELHVWDGLGHGFHYDDKLQESHELHERLVAFFKHYLGQK